MLACSTVYGALRGATEALQHRERPAKVAELALHGARDSLRELRRRVQMWWPGFLVAAAVAATSTVGKANVAWDLLAACFFICRSPSPQVAVAVAALKWAYPPVTAA